MIIKVNTHSFVRCWSRDVSFQFTWWCGEARLWSNYWNNSTGFLSAYGWSRSWTRRMCSSRSWSANI